MIESPALFQLTGRLDRLDLRDHPILDTQIGPEPDIDPNRPVDHRNCLLVDRLESTLSKFVCEH